MTEFLLALAIFLAAHVIPSRTGLRAWLICKLGERTYFLSYSLVSLALLVWLIAAAIRAPVVPLWPTSQAYYLVALALMLPASMLLVGGAATSNPLSVGFVSAGYDPSVPGLVGVTRHPLLWGFALWAIAHVFPNGELVPLIIRGLRPIRAVRDADRRSTQAPAAESRVGAPCRAHVDIPVRRLVDQSGVAAMAPSRSGHDLAGRRRSLSALPVASPASDWSRPGGRSSIGYRRWWLPTRPAGLPILNAVDHSRVVC